jgi:hypothetical protein
MSALNVTQAEADVLLDSLRMFAEVHRNAGGAVPAEVADLLAKLTPAPVVEVVTPVKKAKEVVEETKDE